MHACTKTPETGTGARSTIGGDSWETYDHPTMPETYAALPGLSTITAQVKQSPAYRELVNDQHENPQDYETPDDPESVERVQRAQENRWQFAYLALRAAIRTPDQTPPTYWPVDFAAQPWERLSRSLADFTRDKDYLTSGEALDRQPPTLTLTGLAASLVAQPAAPPARGYSLSA